MPFLISAWILSHWVRLTTGPMVVPSARGSPALVLSATPLAMAATSFIFDSGTSMRDLAGDLVQRPVPGRDHADHADGLAQDDGGAEILLKMVVLQHFQRRGDMAETGAGLQPLGHRQRRTHLVGNGGADFLHAAL